MVEIATPLTKTTYEVGDKLDPAGAKLKVTYSDKSTEEIDITPGMCSEFDSSKPGKQTITVTYEEKAAKFTVTVVDKAVEDVVHIGGNSTYKSIADFLKALKKTGVKGSTYTLDIGEALTEKSITLPKDYSFVITGGILTTGTITANGNVVLDCEVKPVAKSVNFKIGNRGFCCEWKKRRYGYRCRICVFCIGIMRVVELMC